MLKKRIISASLMCADFCNLAKVVGLLEKGGCDWLHFDIMDGIFVPNITLGPDVIRAIKKITKMKMDVHLMIIDPIRYIKQFVDAGSDILTVHIESCVHIHRVIMNIKEHNVKVGIALNPSTNLDTIEYLLPEIDIVLIMSVNPGFAGQKFIPFTVDKVRKLKQKIVQHGLENKIDIQVDGNINETTTAQLLEAGANSFVAGTSFIFKPNADIYKNTQEMRKFLDTYK